MDQDLYRRAQMAMTELKSCVRALLVNAGATGATNAEVGRQLGIYAGHVGHEGHISRTLLGILAAEGVIGQDEETKRWYLAGVRANAD